ncbi:MAG: 3-hydroxyacyl-ACP dehydratase FabZ [Gammaproteobacteria bacterium]|nr:3-hydroxyacyl-ACP dehydratase FabZ [Gammaproteobacteria bacterium]
MSTSETFDIHRIMEYLPHRYPFLLVDRVIECVPNERLVAIKNVTINEPFFIGHFPDRPVMPGVLIAEAMAQATGLLAFRSVGVPPEHILYYLVGIDKAKFRRPVEPGDQLRLFATIRRSLRGVWCFDVSAEVDGKEVASAEIRCAAKEITT